VSPGLDEHILTSTFVLLVSDPELTTGPPQEGRTLRLHETPCNPIIASFTGEHVGEPRSLSVSTRRCSTSISNL